MRTSWIVMCVALVACGSAAPAQSAGRGELEDRRTHSGSGFPTYSREEETNACLYGYGMENSSIVDCVARDETFRVALSKTWSDIDDRFKKDCMLRLSHRRLNSYYYLDHCIKSLQSDAATPPD